MLRVFHYCVWCVLWRRYYIHMTDPKSSKLGNYAYNFDCDVCIHFADSNCAMQKYIIHKCKNVFVSYLEITIIYKDNWY